MIKKRGIDIFQKKIQPILNPNQSVDAPEDDLDEIYDKFTTIPDHWNSPFFPKNHQRSPDKGVKKEEELKEKKPGKVLMPNGLYANGLIGPISSRS